MALDRKLEAWTAAGLIDVGAAERIRAFEDANDRPWTLWAVVGLGLFALALGIMLVVAANWDAIPDWLKLGVHLAATAATVAGVWFAFARERRWLAEGLLFVLAALVLAGIALHSQVYQLVGPTWQALLLWFGLVAPALLVAGRTRLTGYLLALMLLWLLGDIVFEHDSRDWLFVHAVALAGPPLLILVSLLPRPAGEFANGLREVGIVAILGGASLAHFAWAEQISRLEAADMAIRLLLSAIVVAGAIAAGRRWRRIPAALLLPLLAGPLAAVALAAAVPHGDGWLPRFAGALAFAGMWGWVAAAAAASGWRTLFGIAVAAIAIRIFIVYFELFGTLATTGFGLILGGGLLIVLALGWRRAFRLAGRAS
jgi:uncharacterized membrane protein